jgi:putative ABC transport system permease protein
MIALYSINLRILGLRANLPLLNVATIFDPARDWLAPLVGGGGLAQRYAAILILGLIVLLILGLSWFLHTELGLALRATGDKEQIAGAQGISVDRIKV